MEKFTKVPAKITVKDLESQPIDIKREQLIEEHKKRVMD
jgi:hypothetical protein